MSCKSCADMQEQDGAVPRCKTPDGCLIPTPGVIGQEALRLRGLIMKLEGLSSPAEVMQMYGGTTEHLILIAEIEGELKGTGNHNG